MKCIYSALIIILLLCTSASAQVDSSGVDVVVRGNYSYWELMDTTGMPADSQAMRLRQYWRGNVIQVFPMYSLENGKIGSKITAPNWCILRIPSLPVANVLNFMDHHTDSTQYEVDPASGDTIYYNKYRRDWIVDSAVLDGIMPEMAANGFVLIGNYNAWKKNLVRRSEQ